MVNIVKQNYSENKKKYKKIEKELKKKLGENVPISHVGSTAIPRMSGKNIIDILIGAVDNKDFNKLSKEIVDLGYYKSRNNKETEYQFFASKETETTAGDIHIHLAIKKTQRYKDFIILRDYLLKNSNEAKLYIEVKKKIVTNKSKDRKIYKDMKSKYVDELLKRARRYNGENLPISITLIRHGENTNNLDLPNYLLPLSEKGKKEAKWASSMVSNDFDVIITSTSKRTILTAEIINKDMKIINDSRLLERGWGNDKQDGTETDKEAKERFRKIFLEICQRYKNKKVLIVTHGGLMKLAQDVIEGINLPRDNIDNCNIIKYTRKNRKGIILDYFCYKYISKPYDKNMKIETI